MEGWHSCCSNIETLEFRSKEKVPCLHTQSLSKVIKRTPTSVKNILRVALNVIGLWSGL